MTFFEDDIQEDSIPPVRIIQRPALDNWLEAALVSLDENTYRPSGRDRKWRRDQAAKKGK